MTLRGLVWVVVVLVSMFAATYVFNSTGGRAGSAWVLWEKNMTMKGRWHYNHLGAARRI
jgi:hypothetical protein